MYKIRDMITTIKSDINEDVTGESGEEMPELIIVASDIPGAENIRDMFAAYGYRVEVRDYYEAILWGDPCALLLSMDNQRLGVDERVRGLRGAGYQGTILVLGRISPDLDVRQCLAGMNAWFFPAYSGPADVVARVRQLLV